jgi:cation:H+ antiporter
VGEDAVEFAGQGTLRRDVGLIVMGLVGTVAVAQALVWGATEMATSLGMSEAMVGLTIVALGTSLPELATAIQAARKKETDLIVGNLLGSNIFNSLGVVGASVIVGPGQLDAQLALVSGLCMVAAAITITAAAWTRQTITRRNGLLMIAFYPLILIALTR